MTTARWWHLLTAVVATFALVLQFVLVWQGHSVLEEVEPPALGERWCASSATSRSCPTG